MFKNLIIIVTLFSSFCNVFGAGNATGETLTLHLKPLYDSSGKANSIHVSYEVVFEDNLRSDHTLNLHFDLMQNHGRKADQIYDLMVKDQDGVVKINLPKKDAENNVIVYEAARKVNGKVTVEYTVTAASPNRKGGANIDMQASGGGLTGSLISILLLQPFEKDVFVKLDWELAEGNTAVSSFGVGNKTSLVKLSYGSLQYTQFIIGRLTMYPSPLPEKGFSVAGLGLPEESIGNSLPQFENVYEYLRTQFQGSPDLAFRFFFRSYPELPSSSGSAVQGDGYGSFLVCIPQAEKLRDNEDMFALVNHEMLHVFITGLSKEWYREGIAEYLSTILPYKGKYYSDAFYLKSINEKAANYYTNSLRLLPDSAGGKLKFSSANSWIVPYSRGFLYFANLDAKLKILKKGSQTSVLSLAMEMEKLKRTQANDENTWVGLIRKEAGEWAVKDWQDMKSGKLIIPIPGAFGDDIIPEKLKTGIFDLGFNKSGKIVKGDIIKDLIKDSNAAKAGIKEGDEVVESVDLYPLFGSFDKTLTVKIKRNKEILSFSFIPRRGSVEGYHWVSAKSKL